MHCLLDYDAKVLLAWHESLKGDNRFTEFLLHNGFPELAALSRAILSDLDALCVADPGHLVVAEAHRMGIQVVPLVGPSSIVLALMASGLGGQNFAFHGYLPMEQPDRERRLKQLEAVCLKYHQTQIFIETPYRNNHLFNSIVSVCAPNLRLCVAANLTCEDEMICTKTIAQWRKTTLNLHKQPAIFLLNL